MTTGSSPPNAKKKAVVLLSGGVDSTTVLCIAQGEGFEVYAMSFRYGQRHEAEIDAARRIAERYGAARRGTSWWRSTCACSAAPL